MLLVHNTEERFRRKLLIYMGYISPFKYIFYDDRDLTKAYTFGDTKVY